MAHAKYQSDCRTAGDRKKRDSAPGWKRGSSWGTTVVLAISALSSSHCVSSYEILGAAGSGGATTGGAGGTVMGHGGSSAGASALVACVTDDDCDRLQWCTDGICSRCADSFPCDSTMLVFQRNGCDWCVPAGDCKTDLECASDDICYSGQTCSPDCRNDTTCCYGNVCSASGCGSTAGLDCAVVGCPAGYYCDVLDPDQICACAEGSWSCTPGSRNTCRPY